MELALARRIVQYGIDNSGDCSSQQVAVFTLLAELERNVTEVRRLQKRILDMLVLEMKLSSESEAASLTMATNAFREINKLRSQGDSQPAGQSGTQEIINQP